MTDLLAPTRRTPTSTSRPSRHRSPVVLSALGGVATAGVALLLTVAVALAGWFAADAGRYGDTRDATRVGADAWLLALGAPLDLGTATVSVMPLGLSLLTAWLAFAVGRRIASRAGLGASAPELSAVVGSVAVMAVVHGLVAMVVAVMATHPRAEADPLRALAGGLVLCLVGGGPGLLVGSGQARAVMPRLPAWARGVLAGAAATVLLMLAASAFLLTASLLLDFGTAATVLSRLHADGPGGLMYTAVGILYVPNAVLLSSAYLLGPGFAVGTGTLVSPTAVVLGPLPSFPLLAALPDAGATPDWTAGLVSLPVLLAVAGVALSSRLVPPARWDVGAVRGLGAGLLAAVVLVALVLLAGGAAGPGRMADLGAEPVAVLLAATVSCGGGGLVGGLIGAGLSRRRTSAA